MDSEIIIVMKNISKIFPGVKALDNVTLQVAKGEVHALVGENGAGKSTLIKILSGVHRPDSGQIIYKGREIRIESPSQARGLGISTIYQELNLCPNLMVAENIFLGNEPGRTYFSYINDNQLNKECRKYLDLLEADVNPTTIVSNLSVAQKQVVEIAKALSYESEIIIMDEPTASLTLHETDRLFKIIQKLKGQGKSIIYISHRLEEVFKIADIITILKDGKLMCTRPINELSYGDIVRMMVGREIQDKYIRTTKTVEKKVECLLEVKDFTKKGLFKNINFTLHAGEILGFAGLVGAGRTELMRALFGLEHVDKGKIIIDGKEIVFKSPKEAINAGIGMTSEDRKRGSLFLNFNIRENTTISCLDYLSKYGYVIGIKEKGFANNYIKQLDIKPQNSEVLTLNLSGGNQQKVAIAKWLATGPDILIMDEPTRGIDVGAKSEIYKLIKSLAEQGKGIILVSSELPEILSLSDRIIVMNKGEIVGDFINEEVTEEKIMELAV